jgi:long-chain acyl-CoA synthetase
MIAPLPLYHIYAFTANCMCMMVTGNHNVLITNPRHRRLYQGAEEMAVSGLLGLNTLFVALMDHPDFKPWISPASSSPTPAAPRWSRPPPSAGSR